MIVVALTGSIGMGKSTVLQMFADLGAAVWSADDAVHRLYAKGGAAIPPIAQEFPGAVVNGAVDRERLAALVLDQPQRLKRLEALVHPLVAADREAFLALAKKSGAEIAVVDIPLLIETGGEKAFDAVVVASAPAALQRRRVLTRPGMTIEKFETIRRRQTPDVEKRARADFVINTGQSLAATRKEVEAAMAALRARRAPDPAA
ncbi:MAG: dephospho-CoA kinase [Parvularculaceae bacterium]